MFSISSDKSDFPEYTGKKLKVIINSGGGVFGYIISNFMSFLNFDLYSKVDLVAGTSIGGILALAYCVNSNYKWLNKFFKIGSQHIFSDRKSVLLKGIKYDNRNLIKFLKEVFGDMMFSDLKKKAIITTTDFTLKIPRVFENLNLKKEQDLSLVDLSLFTSAAPTFFKAHKYPWKTLEYDPNEIPMNEKILLNSARRSNEDPAPQEKYSVIFDGGVLENIPIMSTYAILHTELGVKPEDIDVFVFGAGEHSDDHRYSLSEVNNWSVLDTLKNLIVPYVTDSNEQTALFWGLQMGFNYFKYYNPIKIEGAMDNLDMIPKIEKQCLEHKEEFLEEINKFLNK